MSSNPLPATIAEFGLNTAFGAVGLIGGPPGWIISGTYFIFSNSSIDKNQLPNFNYPFPVQDNLPLKR